MKNNLGRGMLLRNIKLTMVLSVAIGLMGLGLLWLLIAVVQRSPSRHESVGSANSLSSSAEVTLIAAGDIAQCSTPSDATAQLLDQLPGTIITLGDNAYGSGTLWEFVRCYSPTWGRFKARTRPVPGNHDYKTARAFGYFSYFGAAAGDPQLGYYSYDLGQWHIVALNSNCQAVGGCEANSPQEQWLRNDLATHPNVCTLAYWHHPLFSSGHNGGTDSTRDLWQALYDNKADVVLNGHDHNYERFAPQDAVGQLDLERGLREFVVGTGGAELRSMRTLQPNSEASNSTTFGALQLKLESNQYSWSFVAIENGEFADAGTATCN